MGNDPIQGGGRGTYVALETSSTMGRWDRPPRGAGRRSRRSTRRAGKPSTGGRAAGVRKPGRGGPRDALCRNRTGNHPRSRQVRCSSPAVLGTLESRVLRNGACPVRGGAVGKVPVTATR